MIHPGLNETKNKNLGTIVMQLSRLPILFFVFFFVSSICAQQPIDVQWNYAERLFNDKKFFEAVTEYKRVQFFDETDKYLFETNYKIALSYKSGAFFNNSIDYFSKAYKICRKDSLKCELQLQIIRCNILRKTTARALQLLDELEVGRHKSCSTEDIDYWKGWTYMFADNWDSAYAHFSKVDYAEDLMNICSAVITDKYSVTFAKVISYILPGSGQFYTGNYVSGLLSFSWNLLLGYFTLNAFVEERIFDGIVIGSLLWLRFYRGNIHNAETFAIEKNLSIANKALLKIQRDYKGIKP